MRSSTEPFRSPTPLIEARTTDCAACMIRHVCLFAGLDADEIEDCTPSIRNGLFTANRVIYRAGEPATAAFTIRWGVVKVLRVSRAGGEHVVRLLGRGAAIGLEAFDGERYENTAIATREGGLCVIPRSVLRGLGKRSAGFHHGLTSKWREHAVQSEIWASCLYEGSLEERLHGLIGRLCEVSGDPPEAVRLLRSEDLAGLLGVTRETLSRSLARLKRRGLMRQVGPWTYDCRLLLAETGPAVLQSAQPAVLSVLRRAS